MGFASQLFLYTAIASTVFLAIGLYKPWIMLWWEDVQNRRKVIRLYGTISLLAITAFIITKIL